MHRAIRARRVANADLLMAVVCLIGVVALGIGYLSASKVAFYFGLFLILGGVVSGALRVVTRSRRVVGRR